MQCNENSCHSSWIHFDWRNLLLFLHLLLLLTLHLFFFCLLFSISLQFLWLWFFFHISTIRFFIFSSLQAFLLCYYFYLSSLLSVRVFSPFCILVMAVQNKMRTIYTIIFYSWKDSLDSIRTVERFDGAIVQCNVVPELILSCCQGTSLMKPRF